jgi:hypothetical protein
MRPPASGPWPRTRSRRRELRYIRCSDENRIADLHTAWSCEKCGHGGRGAFDAVVEEDVFAFAGKEDGYEEDN